MEKMKFETPDMAQMNVEKIAALFPNCVTESKAKDGKLKKAVNFDALKQMLGESVAEGDESYEFTWVGKRDAMVEAAKPIRKTLRPCVEESKNFDTTENLYIEGDNLEALKLLQEGYLGKVKMIYIDPPYNTGNDFIYKDDFRMDSAKYAEESGAVDDEGNRMVQNSDSNGRFHSDWSSMIYSRLLLARNLLTDDGVIFISIDDNEQANLKKICDEVFGGSNFYAQIVWQKRTSPDARFNLGAAHDYITVIAKNFNVLKETLKKLPLSEERCSQYKNPDNDPRGPWASVDITGQTGHATGSQFYKIVTPGGTEMYPPAGRCWALAQSTFESLCKDNRIWFGDDGNSRPRQKKFLSEGDGGNVWTWWTNNEVGHNQEGAKDVKSLLGTGDLFSNPKPIRLIHRILQLASNDNSLILDFFSGSATTAHAVMQLNAEDGGHRKFIMVQLPEKCDENSEAAKAGYKTICEIGKERIRRAGDQILELSLQNLEKEGIVEKYARELPEIRSLEEVYGPSGIGLCLGEEVAEGGNIRSVGSNSQGCGVDSVEHSGGAISGEQGVCPVFENSKGITSRTGNTIVDLRTLKILNENGYRIKLEALGRNQQNDLFADKAFDIKGLSSKLSVLNSDRGFRVLKIDDSNMKDVYYSAGEISQQDLVEQISNIKDGRTDMDLLFGCLVDWGVSLSLPIKTETIENLQVYNVNDGDLVACFANNIPEAAIRQIAAAKPLRAVFRDSSFKSDSAKINVTEIFKTISPNTTVKVV